MPPTPLPALIVAPCDLGPAQALDLACALRVWAGGDTLEGQPLQACTAQVLGALCLSQEGQTQLAGLGAAWEAATGLPALPLHDLSRLAPSEQREAAAQAQAALLAPAYSTLAQHNAALLGQLAQLRMAHEDLAIAARKREQRLLSQSGGQRWLTQAHGPLERGAEGAHLLAPGARICQRLKVGSDGLSDIAVFLPDQPLPESGEVTARLHLGESGDVIGSWQIPARKLAPGWLRLSLVTALADDLQTVTLELVWQGDAPLRLGAGVHHPDPALCAQIEGAAQDQILAHKVWKYMAGCTPPLPVEGHIAAPAPAGTQYYIDLAQLERALEGDPEAPCLRFYRALEALQVHPRPETLTAARLPSAVPPGITQITAVVGARAPICPVMEYALAVVPRHPLRPLADLAAEAARAGHMSDWVRREADAMGEVTLVLPAPHSESADLLLITRVPPGKRAAYGWATFRDIRMSA